MLLLVASGAIVVPVEEPMVIRSVVDQLCELLPLGIVLLGSGVQSTIAGVVATISVVDELSVVEEVSGLVGLVLTGVVVKLIAVLVSLAGAVLSLDDVLLPDVVLVDSVVELRITCVVVVLSSTACVVLMSMSVVDVTAV